MPLLPRRVATAADSAARPVPNRTTVTGSGIVTGPPGTGVTVATGVVLAVAEAMALGVEVGPAGGVFVAVGGTGVNVGGSVVGVSPAGASCAKTTAGTAAKDRNRTIANATNRPTRVELDRFIDRPLLMITGASFQILSKNRSRCINARQT